jgi:hypothetical protein
MKNEKGRKNKLWNRKEKTLRKRREDVYNEEA